MQEFQSTNIKLGTIAVSIYVLGFAAGPMVLAPLSEQYGRLPIYHICNVGFLIFNIACAVSSNLSMLIGFRILAGVFSSAPLIIGGGTIADYVTLKRRGTALSAFAIGLLLGPVIGPLAGGYLAQAKSWRWVFWVLSMYSGLLTLLCFAFMRETCAVTILNRKAKRLRKETGNPNFRSKLDLGLSPKDLF
jgi:multidrug resistance protein